MPRDLSSYRTHPRLRRTTGSQRWKNLWGASAKSSRRPLIVRLSCAPPISEPNLHSLGIGCAGEIRINEHEDYEKWAIDILVKFRDSEKLQLLTGQRQSGGVSLNQNCIEASIYGLTEPQSQERSLTTILYLMSLTEEARAPFSLVDEINQVH